MLDTGCHEDSAGHLSKLPTVEISINGHPAKLWVADNTSDQNRGLMHVSKDQLAPLPNGADRGMLFVFNRSVRDGFWMKNTIIPLDIAYVASDGTIVTICTMTPLDTRHGVYTPTAPYRYAIELNAHRFADLGVKAGDRIEIPPSLLKRSQ